MMSLEKEMLEVLEAEPIPDSLGLASLAPGNDIPAKREKLAILVSTGKQSAHTRPGQTPVG